MEIVSERRTQENVVVTEVKVSVKELDAAAQAAYLRRRGDFQIFGSRFRKGRATRRMLEERYGRHLFYREGVGMTGRRAAEAVAEHLEEKTFGRPGIRFCGKCGPREAFFRITYVLQPAAEIAGYKGLKVEAAGESEAGDAQGVQDPEDLLAWKLAGMIKGDIPELAYEYRVAYMLREWNRRTGTLSLQDYLAYTGQTEEAFRESFREPAKIQVKFRLALLKIAELEGITATVAEISAHYRELAKRYRTDVERVQTVIPPRRIEDHLVMLKAFDWVKAHADPAF